ncbi:hypothetical protein L6R50_22975 [Myxococcota bacterium]|nr:hypothetical protein [Myxococcota bacterium]
MRPAAPLALALAACGPAPPGGAAPPSDDGVAPADDDAGGPVETALAPAGSPVPCVPAAGEPVLDAYGGDSRASLGATGWFRVQRFCGRWWFVTPDGHPFWSAGINTLHPDGDAGQDTGRREYAETVAALYADDDAWADAAVERLRSWGFNTVGGWSDVGLAAPRLPFTRELGLAGDDWQTGEVADYFDPAWEDAVRGLVAEKVAPYTQEPRVVGWFLDNEVKWGPDWRGAATLLQEYLAFPAEAPGKAAAVAVILDGLGGIGGVSAFLGREYAAEADLLAETDPAAWDPLDAGSSEAEAALTTAFLEVAAERYFSVAVAAVREADPHHLVLGNRDVAVMTRAEVHRAAARHVDAISVNAYSYVDGIAELAQQMSGALDPAGGFAALADLTGLPVMVTEYGFRAADSGLPNSWPPQYPTLATQEDRADAFEAALRDAFAAPWIVGAHWYRWVDDPAEGRFDGEDNNWGVVDVGDRPYEVLTERMAEAHPGWSALLSVPELSP